MQYQNQDDMTTAIPLAFPSINEFLGWIVTAGIVVIFITVWRIGVRIEHRIGRLDGDRRVLDERINNAKENIDKIDNRLRDIERFVWKASPSRAKSIRERIDEEQEGEDRTP